VAVAAIETHGLTKYYGPVVGLENLSIEVAQGEVFGFLGANGAGKTTTIRMLLDLVRPSSGSASILGFDCHRQSLESRRRIGYLPGEMPFYPELTGARYLSFLSSLGPTRPSPGRIASLLRRFDVSDLDLKRRMRDYSHGMKRKLGLVQALMTDPPLLILDEPTSGLDPQATVELLNIIRDLKHRGVSVLLSSHLLDRVQSVCDRVALFSQGNIALIGSVPDLGRQVLGGGFRVEVEAEGQGLAERIAAIPGVQRVETAAANRLLLHADRDVRPEAAAAVVAAGGRLLRLSVEEPSLEAIYTGYFKTHEGERHAA
jgi:ABC-2 type transport system ATP-binding protein